MSKGILPILEAIIGDDDDDYVKANALENISAEEALDRARAIINFVPGQKIRFFSNGRFENAIFFRMEEDFPRCECFTFGEKGYFCLNRVVMSSIVLPGEGDEEYLAKIGKTSASSD